MDNVSDLICLIMDVMVFFGEEIIFGNFMECVVIFIFE